MLGVALRSVLGERGHELFATDIDASNEGIGYLDVRNLNQVLGLAEKIKPEIIIHLAAETDVDKCELKPDHAYWTNTVGTQNVALTCQKEEIVMVYIGTIGVFDGSKSEPYTEFDQPNPINIYGKSKFAGERIVHSLLRKYYIVRAGWMMGGGLGKDKKFVAKIIRLMDETNELRVVTDKIGSLTYTWDFSRCLSDLIETGRYGLYHCTCKGYASRFEIAKRIAEYLRRSDVIIKPVTSDHFPLPAPRPRSEASNNYMLGLLGMDKMRHWDEALIEYLTVEWNAKKTV